MTTADIWHPQVLSQDLTVLDYAVTWNIKTSSLTWLRTQQIFCHPAAEFYPLTVTRITLRCDNGINMGVNHQPSATT